MYTQSNATQDWTLHTHVLHTSKGFSAHENRFWSAAENDYT